MLDAIDLRILALLEVNARISNKMLAKRAQLSESACSERVRRLEKTGIIQGYRAIISQQETALPFEVVADISLTGLSLSTRQEMAKLLASNDCVIETFQMAGAFSFVVHVVAPHRGVWTALCDDLSRMGIGASRIRYGVVQHRTICGSLS